MSCDHQDDDNTHEALDILKTFLDNILNTFQEPSRQKCPRCTASRSIYCYDCCEILFSKEELPEGVREGVDLPFSLDLILDDKRPSSTGIHAFSVLKTTSGVDSVNQYRLLDQGQVSGIPDYSTENGVYFLFPSDTSVGLSTVAAEVRRLVVLDCRWSKSYLRRDPRLAMLPKVHLDNPPQESFFWRWHNSGAGMLSTIEAIYFAAWEVAHQQHWALDRRQSLVNILWIFGLQRAVIKFRYESGYGHSVIPYTPFSEEGKAFARKLRIRTERDTE